MTLPVNPGFASLNLANAVAVFAYAYAEARQETDAPSWFKSDNPPATQEELEGMFQHLEQELEHGRFFHPMDKAPLMKRNLRALFLRARLTQQEAQTMRGVIKALTIGRGGRKKDDE
jgi:tRNA/rRNA methyltransferase